MNGFPPDAFSLDGFDLDAFVAATLAEDLGPDGRDVTSEAVIPADAMFEGVMDSRDAVTLAGFDPDSEADILISAARAETLKLANQLAAADPDLPVLIERAPWIDADVATSIADPVLDLASPLKGPFRARPIASPQAAKAALLAKLEQVEGREAYGAFGGAPVELKADKEVVLAAVAQSGEALYHASEALKADREVVLAAIAQNPYALRRVSCTRTPR